METQNITENIVITEAKKRGRPKKGMEKPKVSEGDQKRN